MKIIMFISAYHGRYGMFLMSDWNAFEHQGLSVGMGRTEWEIGKLFPLSFFF